MTDPNLDLVVADWRDAVHMFLESPIGKGVLQGLSPAEAPILVALLETMVHIPASTETHLTQKLDAWRAGRERELRNSLSINLYATTDGPPDDDEVARRFIELRALARGNVRDVEKHVVHAVASPQQDAQEFADSDMDMPTVRPDAFPTSPVKYDSQALELAFSRESVPEGFELTRLEDGIKKSMATVTASRSGEFRAINPPPSAERTPIPRPAPQSPAPSLESFGFKPDTEKVAGVGVLDDPMSGDLEPGESHSPPQASGRPHADTDAPSIEVGESAELNEDDELDLAFEYALNPVPSRK